MLTANIVSNSIICQHFGSVLCPVCTSLNGHWLNLKGKKRLFASAPLGKQTKVTSHQVALCLTTKLTAEVIIIEIIQEPLLSREKEFRVVPDSRQKSFQIQQDFAMRI